jgi:hypothetical protein
MTDGAPKKNLLADVPPSLRVWMGVGVAAVVLVIALGVGLYVTWQPSFLSGYQVYQRNVSTMQTSGHKELTCDQCHVDSSSQVSYRAGLVGDFYVRVFRRSEAPVFTKLGKPTNAACLKCHAYDWSVESSMTADVPHPAHLRVIDEKRDCVLCHRWTAHEEDYMQQHKKMPFSTVCASFPCHVGYKPASDCKNCHHQLQQSLGVWKQEHPKVVAEAGTNGCIEKCHDAEQCRTCHTTGKAPAFSKTINASTVTAIESAHVKKDWLTQHGTFALQDESKCMTCHLTLGECEDCHSKRPAFHGTDTTAWIGTHKDVAKDRRRCLACHENAWCEECHKQFKEMR